MDIGWLIFTEYNYTIVRAVENVTATIVNNSAVYTDRLVTPPLSVNDINRVYHCEVNINSTFGVSSHDTIVLDFIGKYVANMYVHTNVYIYVHTICMYLRTYAFTYTVDLKKINILFL